MPNNSNRIIRSAALLLAWLAFLFSTGCQQGVYLLVDLGNRVLTLVG